MNKVIVDSHILLWALQQPEKINSAQAKNALNTSTDRYVSLATIWELGLKHRKGKLNFSASQLLSGVNELGMTILPITKEHIVESVALTNSHNDPFDLLLLAQAKIEGFALISADKIIIEVGSDYVINARNK